MITHPFLKSFPKMQTFLFTVILSSLIIPLRSTPTPPPLHHHQSHLIKRTSNHRSSNAASASGPQEYLEVTGPLPFDALKPSCILPILSHNFSNTYGLPPVSVPYSPPPLNCKWSHVTLQIHAACKGEQYDRIAAVWLGGAELLRTSTAEPTENGIFWNVRKDVTRYSSLLARDNLNLSVMLENIVNEVFTGVYQINVTFLYYDTALIALPVENEEDFHGSSRKLKSLENPLKSKGSSYEKGSFDLYERTPDMVIPISGDGDGGFWFKIEKETDVHSRGVRIPRNAYRAVIEVYSSAHGDDEFWYSNPPDAYLEMRNAVEAGQKIPPKSYAAMKKVRSKRGHGSYRELLVKIDGDLVGSVVPFPVIFTGGINPLFWEPVVGIGTFDLPSYDIELSPFLGRLLDGKVHSFSLHVADSIPFWLVDANLLLWLDAGSLEVQARIGSNEPEFSLERQYNFKGLDGKFEVEAERKEEISGWMNSSAGNFTTWFLQELEFENNGLRKSVEQTVKYKSEFRIKLGSDRVIFHTIAERKYPLKVTTEVLPGWGSDACAMRTSVETSIKEKKKKMANLESVSKNSQECRGWMSVKDHEVLSGGAHTQQHYSYKDGCKCHSRIVAAENGTLLNDRTSLSC